MSEERKHVGLYRGRLNRAKFTVYFFINFFVYTAIFFALYLMPSDSALVTVLGILATALYLLVLGMITVKRAHDIKWRGAWFGLILIPVAYIVLLILLMIKDGTKGPNKYGEDPLGRPASQKDNSEHHE